MWHHRHINHIMVVADGLAPVGVVLANDQFTQQISPRSRIITDGFSKTEKISRQCVRKGSSGSNKALD